MQSPFVARGLTTARTAVIEPDITGVAQDDASEDPLTAAKAGATGAADLYKHKMIPAIKEVFATCLPSAELQVNQQRNCPADHLVPYLDLASAYLRLRLLQASALNGGRQHHCATNELTGGPVVQCRMQRL